MNASLPTWIRARFERVTRVRSGPFGTVYRARDLAEGGMVALKVLHGMEDDLWRFERQAHVLTQLQHPGIVRCLAHGCDPDGHPYLAFEWLEGQTLAARLQRGVLSVEEALRLGTRIVAALQSARSLDLVHQDLKPANLFLVNDDIDRVKVLDFGLAGARQDEEHSHSRARGITRTLSYVSPEQALGEPISHRSDVFSLGVVLYECLAGRLPFEGKTPMATLMKICGDEPRPLAEIRSEVPEVLSAFIAQMLAKQPEERPSYVRIRETLASLLVRGTAQP